MDFRDKKLFSFSLLFLAVISCTSALFGADQDADSRRRVARLCTQLKPQACAAIARQQHANEKTATSRTRWEAFADEYLKNIALEDPQKASIETLLTYLRPTDHNHLMEEYEYDLWHDIRLYHNANNPSGTVLNAISRCKTLAGQLTLGIALASPTTDLARLRSKQDITLTLQEDETFQNICRDLVSLKNNERAFIDPEKTFDTNNLLKNSHFLFSYIVMHPNLSEAFFSLDLPHSASMVGSVCLTLKEFIRNLIYTRLEELKIFSMTQSLSLSLSGLYKDISASFIDIKKCIRFQRELIKISKFLHTVANLHKKIGNNPSLRQHLPTPYLDTLFDETKHETLPKTVKKFMELITSKTFRGEASIFSRLGRVLPAAYFFGLSKEFFFGVLEDIGRIDAAVSVAQLMKETHGTQNEYCFPEYVSAEKPYVSLQSFWNPQLDPNIAVSSSIEMGEGCKHRNAIVMGPNGGGKSTTTSAIFFSLYLGETLGICPALTARFTPFDVLATFLEIPDEITSNLSKFMAEGAKIKNVLNLARHTAQRGGKIYLYMDEIITGTDPKHAAAIAYVVTKKLGLKPYVMLTLCTHYPNLAKLGTEYQDHFGLYTVPSQVETNGSITHSYRLKQGAYTSGGTQFATLRGQGVDENIIQEAKHIVLQSKL